MAGRPGLRRWLCAAGLVAVMAGAACRRSGQLPDARADGGYNLLLITLDTTRPDRLGAYGCRSARTPNLDRLASEGVCFTDSHTSVPLTLPAHATLFTGREPPAHQVRNNGTYALRAAEKTLAEQFKAAGYATQAIVSAFVLEAKFGLNQGFDGYDDALDSRDNGGSFRSEIPADRVTAKFRRWLASRGQAPFFCWLHFYDPHAPYQPPPRWADAMPGDPYGGEIAFVDENIGLVRQALADSGLLERTLIVVVGDHGESFGEHDEFGHGIFCYEPTLRIPLVVWQPRLFARRTVDQAVGLVDVMPTLLEMFRLPAPDGTQGRSFAPLLLAADGGAKPTAARYFESMQGMEEMGWAPLSGVRRGEYKYVSLPEPELYDVVADPAERRNLYLRKNRIARDLDRALRETLRLAANPQQASRRSLSGQDQQSLRALGYLASPGPAAATGPAPDPKRGIALINRLSAAETKIRAGALAEAERELAALGKDPQVMRLPQYVDRLYELYRVRNDVRAAEPMLRDAIARFPEVTRFKLLLASLFQKQNRRAEARMLAQRLLQQDPQFTQAHVMLAELSNADGQAGEALGYMQRAAQSEPGNARLQVQLAGLQADAGQPQAAQQTLRRLLDGGGLTAGGNDPETARDAAALMTKLGDNEGAAALLDSHLRAHPDDASAWTQLGLAQLERGRDDQAGPSLQRALAIDSNQALALSGLGTLYLNAFRREKRGEWLQRAAEFYARARKAAPRLVTAINGSGVVNLYRRDLAAAVADWQEAIRTDPAFVNAYFNLAIAQLSAGRRDEARRLLRTVKSRYETRLSEDERRQLTELLAECGN